MARNHSLALEIQEKIDALDADRAELLEQLADADPALAEQSELLRQTRTITDITFLGEVSSGRVGQKYSSAIGRVLAEMSQEPFIVVNGKTKLFQGKVNMEVTLNAVLGTERVDGRQSQQYLKDVGLDFKITAKVPQYESEVITAAVIQNPNGSIKDVRVNPLNDESPRQLSMFDNGTDRLDD